MSRSKITQFDHPQFGLVWGAVQEDATLREGTEELTRKSEIKKTQENERTRISRELHDELGQTLTVLKMDLFDH